MPTYEYECKAGHRFEKFQSIKDEALKKCLKCGKSAKRLLSMGAGFLFKGSGFYQTDYRSKSYQDGAKKESCAKETPSSSAGCGSAACSQPKDKK
jgi:putative FmdB family regulatory protein